MSPDDAIELFKQAAIVFEELYKQQNILIQELFDLKARLERLEKEVREKSE